MCIKHIFLCLFCHSFHFGVMQHLTGKSACSRVDEICIRTLKQWLEAFYSYYYSITEQAHTTHILWSGSIILNWWWYLWFMKWIIPMMRISRKAVRKREKFKRNRQFQRPKYLFCEVLFEIEFVTNSKNRTHTELMWHRHCLLDSIRDNEQSPCFII